MGNKVNYIHAIKFINVFHTPRDQGNERNRAESRKMLLRFFRMDFHGCILFTMNQNAYYALILDQL